MSMLFSLLSCVLLFIFTLRLRISNSFYKLFSIIWLTILILYWMQDDLFLPVSKNFDMVFLSFFWSLIISYTIVYLLLKDLKLPSFSKLLSLKQFYYISLLICSISFVKFFYYLVVYQDFVVLRSAFIDEGLSVHVGVSFPITAAAYFVARHHNDMPHVKIFMYMLFGLALISTSKIFIIISILFASGFGMPNFKLSVRKILSILIIGFGFFSLVHVAMDKIAGKADFPLFQALLFTFSGYLLGGLAVFQLVLDGAFVSFPSDSVITYITGDSRFYITEAIEGGWVRTGEWLGNVTSGFSPWYMVDGLGGIVFVAILIGVLHGFINALSHRSLSFKFMRIFSIYPMCFFVFSDTYISAYLMWVAFFISSIFIALVGSHE